MLGHAPCKAPQALKYPPWHSRLQPHSPQAPYTKAAIDRASHVMKAAPCLSVNGSRTPAPRGPNTSSTQDPCLPQPSHSSIRGHAEQAASVGATPSQRALPARPHGLVYLAAAACALDRHRLAVPRRRRLRQNVRPHNLHPCTKAPVRNASGNAGDSRTGIRHDSLRPSAQWHDLLCERDRQVNEQPLWGACLDQLQVAVRGKVALHVH